MGKTAQFDTNNYEFNPSSKNGVYIIHGFSSTTFEVRELAEYLGNNGFYTRADNLPGHATTVNDCNATKYTEWLAHVEQGVSEMTSKCKNIHVIGISMGAVLALHLASLFPLTSVTAAATVLKFKNEFKIRILTPLFCWLIPKTSKAGQYKDGESLTYFGYTEYPMKALNEMRKLTNVVRSDLHKVKNPAFLIHAKSDMASVIENYHIVKNGISSKVSQDLILENSTHNLFASGPEQSMIFKNVLIFLKKSSSI